MASQDRAIHLLLLLAAVCSLIETNYAITCICDDCLLDSKCEEAGIGAACYSRISLDSEGNIQRQRRCYNPVYADLQCKIHTSIVVIQCCYEDNCNQHLEPVLPNITTTLQPFTGDNHTDDILNPNTNPSTTELPTDNGGPVFITPLICHKHNTKKANSMPTHCTVPVGGGCYHLTRRTSNGSVEFERYGCAENCIEESRNRAIRKCCNTSWCNTLPPTPPPPSTSSTTVEGLQAINATTTTSMNTYSSSLSYEVSGIVTKASSTHNVTTSPSTAERVPLQPSSTYAVKSSSLSTEYSTISSSSTSSSIDAPPTPTSLSSTSSLFESSVIYILCSTVLGVMYVIVISAIIVCIVIIFYKRKMNMKEDDDKRSVEHSTDTLVHGTIV